MIEFVNGLRAKIVFLPKDISGPRWVMKSSTGSENCAWKILSL